MPSTLKRICYVEDEPDIRSIAEFSLIQFGGFSVELCESGQEAIEKAPAFKPDLILLDVMMPGMDGIETFARLKDIPGGQEAPIVFMTAKAMQDEVKRYLSMGAADVIAKTLRSAHSARSTARDLGSPIDGLALRQSAQRPTCWLSRTPPRFHRRYAE
ncbi:MAG TPA: response regulator [Methyloceanibacter sp.]|nr:response regulator [Methyloceanibacter sp.]